MKQCHCPLCLGRADASFISKRGAVYRCAGCGVYFVRDPEMAADQASLFYTTIDEQKYVRYFEPFRKRQYAEVLERLHLVPGITHLDIGASYGWMVEVGVALGFDSLGVEPGNAPVRSQAIQKRIVQASLEHYTATLGPRFDLVTMWHVLEHLPNPEQAVQCIRRLLDDHGRLLIAVPNAEGRLYRVGLALQRGLRRPELMDNLWYFHNPNMHYYYYTPVALAKLMERCGFRQQFSFTMEAFDWTTIHQRADGRLSRTALRVLGPLIGLSGFTRRENLIAVFHTT